MDGDWTMLMSFLPERCRELASEMGAARKGRQVQPRTLEFARYVIVFTTFPEVVRTIEPRLPSAQVIHQWNPISGALAGTPNEDLAALGAPALAVRLAPLTGPGPWAVPVAPRARTGARQVP